MQYDIDQPVTRDPETDPGAEFKERSIGTAFDILRSVRDTCHMAKPKERYQVGVEPHPISALQTNLGRIIDAKRYEVRYEEVGEKAAFDNDDKRMQAGDDPGVHLNLSVRVWEDDGRYDDYAVHINTWGGGIADRSVTDADFHDSARVQGARNHGRRSEDASDIPLRMHVVLSHKGKDRSLISDVILATKNNPSVPNHRIQIRPSVASGVYALEEHRILITGDQDEGIGIPPDVSRKEVGQREINAMNTRLVAQAKELYQLRELARREGVKEDSGYFTSILSLPGVRSTALSA